MVEFTHNCNLIHNIKVDNTQTQNNEEFDIIIGWDIVWDLGINFTFSNSIPSMIWDDISTPICKKSVGQKKNWPNFPHV